VIGHDSDAITLTPTAVGFYVVTIFQEQDRIDRKRIVELNEVDVSARDACLGERVRS
jgi:hypothetical protein